MANITLNRINTTLSAADQTAINDALDIVSNTLNDYSQSLTDEERNSLFSLSQQNLVFAQDAATQGNLLMAKFSPEAQAIVGNLANDLAFWNSLDTLITGRLAQILQRLQDTRRLAGHEAYSGAIALYKIVEAMASIGLEGFEAAYDVLKERFAGQGGRPGE